MMASRPAYQIRRVAEGRAAQLAGVPRSTLQGWDRERFIELPADGAFDERHVLELLLAGALREKVPLAEAKSLWRNLRDAGQIDEFLGLAEQIGDERDQLDMVFDLDFGRVAFARNAKSLVAAVRERHRARTVYVAPLGPCVARAREGFEKFASSESAGRSRRGRPRNAEVSAHPANRSG
jgi:DNA-binding transcriptional MerR regulator